MNKKILILSSSLLTLRFLQFSSFANYNKDKKILIEIWSTSIKKTVKINDHTSLVKFPKVVNYKEFPYNFIRRLNDLVWDYMLKSHSRFHIYKYKQTSFYYKFLHLPAFLLAKLKLGTIIESLTENIILRYCRSVEASEIFKIKNYDLVITTGPHQFFEPAIIAEAKKNNIPVYAYITSWDNLTTKHRMNFKYNGFFVWSKQMKKELNYFYPYTKKIKNFVIGAPQFDVFFEKSYLISKKEFYKRNNLDFSKKTLLYCLGTPNFLDEFFGVLGLLDKLVRSQDLIIKNTQILLRPHPLFNYNNLESQLKKYRKYKIVLQNTQSEPKLEKKHQDNKNIIDWVNTFYHCDLVINLSSTVTVDACIFNKPVINLDFDPAPSKLNQQLIKNINHKWKHFKPLAESGGVTLVDNFDEIIISIKKYLSDPDLHSNEREWIKNYVCGYADGKSGERFYKNLLDILN